MIDKLGDRIKENYENRAKTFLIRRTPVIIRIDGKAFHTWTAGFKKPFDKILIKTMQDTMKYLCENIQGCVLGYTQSDEITLLLIDYKKLNSNAWFDYNVQKMCSVAASMATFAFNKYFELNVAFKKMTTEIFKTTIPDIVDYAKLESVDKEEKEVKIDYDEAYKKAIKKGAIFDARCFNVPKEEVCNTLLFRQQDAERNSVSALARAYYSQKQLNGKSKKEKLVMLEEKGVVWGNLSTPEKRGSCCIKKEVVVELDFETKEVGCSRKSWEVDENIPIFSENRAYIEDLLKPEEE